MYHGIKIVARSMQIQGENLCRGSVDSERRGGEDYQVMELDKLTAIDMRQRAGAGWRQ
jgi:hypothetical protein